MRNETQGCVEGAREALETFLFLYASLECGLCVKRPNDGCKVEMPTECISGALALLAFWKQRPQGIPFLVGSKSNKLNDLEMCPLRGKHYGTRVVHDNSILDTLLRKPSVVRQLCVKCNIPFSFRDSFLQTMSEERLFFYWSFANGKRNTARVEHGVPNESLVECSRHCLPHRLHEGDFAEVDNF